MNNYKVPNLERAVIEIFGGCNYSCKMCPQTDGRGSNWLKNMSIDMFNNILDQLPGNPIINLEGSGEPTLVRNLSEYIRACTDRGFKSYMYTNGSLFKGNLMKECIDAGLSFVRFSCIGYNESKYTEWMGTNNFNLIKNNVIETKKYIMKINSECDVSSYHLILDNKNIDDEVQGYIKNFIEPTGASGYIWKMHNWSGNYDSSYKRNTLIRKSCGRPFAPELTVRAGGVNGLTCAVTPCCQTMGPPNEDTSILGHLENQPLEDIWFGDKYTELREAHKNKDFDSIEYCKDCDFLYDDPEVLVWSSDKNATPNHILGTNFNLDEYKG